MLPNVLDWQSPEYVAISRWVKTPILCYLPVWASPGAGIPKIEPSPFPASLRGRSKNSFQSVQSKPSGEPILIVTASEL
jgi:hypothetical protein